jgi:muramoyltetrapeptide carboxypeptidase
MIDVSRPIVAVAPASAYDPDRLDAGLTWARSQGLDVHLLPGALQPERWLAAPDDVRRRHLIQALTDPKWGAVWLVRGGQGLMRLLADLPAPARRPVIGFSDATVLLAWLASRGAGPAVHGPMLHSVATSDGPSRQDLVDLLGGVPLPPMIGEVLVPGTAEGPLVGGNLAMLAALCGTPWQVSARGALLVLEDVGEPAWRLDRLWSQLQLSGALDGVAGVCFGTFEGCTAGPDWSVRDVLAERALRLGVPAAWNLPIGHGSANRPFTVGAPGRLVDGVLHRG